MIESKYRALLASIAASERRGVDWAAEIEAALAEPTLKAYDKDKCLACGGYHGCSQLPCPEYLPIGADKPIHAVRTDVGKQVVSRPPVQAEPVGSLHISHFRDNPAMENVDFQLIADLKPGSYQLYLHPPAAQVASCSNCERCQESLNALEESAVFEATFEGYKAFVRDNKASSIAGRRVNQPSNMFRVWLHFRAQVAGPTQEAYDAATKALWEHRAANAELVDELEGLRECFIAAAGDKSPFCKLALAPVDAALAKYKGEL